MGKDDRLSPIIFNLASEPLVRAAKVSLGAAVFGQIFPNTVYDDDAAVIAKTSAELQPALDRMDAVAKRVGLSFNSAK